MTILKKISLASFIILVSSSNLNALNMLNGFVFGTISYSPFLHSENVTYLPAYNSRQTTSGSNKGNNIYYSSTSILPIGIGLEFGYMTSFFTPRINIMFNLAYFFAFAYQDKDEEDDIKRIYSNTREIFDDKRLFYSNTFVFDINLGFPLYIDSDFVIQPYVGIGLGYMTHNTVIRNKKYRNRYNSYSNIKDKSHISKFYIPLNNNKNSISFGKFYFPINIGILFVFDSNHALNLGAKFDTIAFKETEYFQGKYTTKQEIKQTIFKIGYSFIF